ncbi:MAG: hypothetical protein E7173_00365 [Firmicutes bacterium]|nr:hypothetical protein [Bacillota bacterium]
MKKILVGLFTILVLTGCTQASSMQMQYNKQMQQLLSVNEDSGYVPCNIELTYDKITDDEVSYQIVFDNPKENMRNINIVVTHDKTTTDGYPSIGVFDEEPINLSTIIDSDNPNKGIVLVGYFEYSGDLKDLNVTFKISINYINDAIEEKTVYYIQSI